MTNLAASLLKAQQEFPHIPLDATNPHFKNKFASLGAILPRVLPVLHKNGIALIQHPTVSEGKPALRTVLLHESGEREEDTMLLVLDKENSQAQGSALTYAKRQAVTAVLALVADEDDDGEAASKPRAKPKPLPLDLRVIDTLTSEYAAILEKPRGTVLEKLTAKFPDWRTDRAQNAQAVAHLKELLAAQVMS